MKQKLFLIFLLTLSLSACEKTTRQINGSYLLTEGLEDCKIYELSGGSGTLYVVRCPNSQTSTTWNRQQGKSNKNYTTVVTETKE